MDTLVIVLPELEYLLRVFRIYWVYPSILRTRRIHFMSGSLRRVLGFESCDILHYHSWYII